MKGKTIKDKIIIICLVLIEIIIIMYSIMLENYWWALSNYLMVGFMMWFCLTIKGNYKTILIIPLWIIALFNDKFDRWLLKVNI